jgi:hypothetical protein
LTLSQYQALKSSIGSGAVDRAIQSLSQDTGNDDADDDDDEE